MITAGIDAGNKFTKAVIIKNGALVSRSLVLSGFDQEKSAGEAYTRALREGGLERKEIDFVAATGAGKAGVVVAGGSVTEVGASARGAIRLFPEARTVVDVGAEEARALQINENGRVLDFAINDKCAAGAGSFIEAMCRTLEISLEEIGPLSLQSRNAVSLNAQCAVFAESEVISLIHARTAKEDIAGAVHDAMAGRIASMVRRVGMRKEIVMIGGVARNPGFVKALEKELELALLLPGEPEYVGALGAALVAADRAG